MADFAGKVALITGASSGIGKATAIELAKRGATVGLLARRQNELEQVAGEMNGKGVVLPADVTDEQAVHDAARKLAEVAGGIDILVAAAGLSLRAPFAQTKAAAAEQIMSVNFMGVVHATQAALPFVVKRKGSLVAVSSLAGRKGTPEYSIYGASKFAVQGLYDALRIELLAEKVHVGILAPGFVDTPLRVNVLNGQGQVHDSPPELPFRVWPVQTCVNRLIRLIKGRQREALIPPFVHYLLSADHLVLRGMVSDRVLASRFRSNGASVPPKPAP